MAIRILGHNVGEADVAQPGDVTTLRWDVNQILLQTGETADVPPEPIFEKIVLVQVTATNRAGEVANGIIDEAGFESGERVDSVAFVRIHNLVDGERYKLKVVATIEANKKVATITIFVPVVAP